MLFCSSYKMKRIIFIIAIFILVLVVAPFIFTDLGSEASASTENTHIYTKAVCNETNYCQDYKIECQGNQLIQMNPITGASVQYSSNWQDTRDEEMINKIC